MLIRNKIQNHYKIIKSIYKNKIQIKGLKQLKLQMKPILPKTLKKIKHKIKIAE